MQTYSHTIITAVGNQLLKRRKSNSPTLPPLRPGASIIGSFSPDLPLTVLSVIFIITDMTRGNTIEPGSGTSLTGQLFSDWFFNNNWVKLLHNLGHAPILTIFYACLGFWVWRQGRQWGGWLFWFGLAMTLHTAIDIPLHYDDGPLLFFPFDWETRFYSPLSYWDPERGGTVWSIFEHSLDIVLIIFYFVLRRQSNQQTPRQNSGQATNH